MSFRRRLISAAVCAAVCICTMSGAKAYAAETYEKTVVEENDTSVIYDMGHVKAQQLSVSSTCYANPSNSYNVLKAPTQIVHEGGYYFIVDCYHNQILYSTGLGTKIPDWKVMTTNVKLPHAIASDGSVYLVADTDNNRILVFEWKSGRFQNTQKFENIGIRPHYIKYDAETDSFFAWSSMTGEMYIFRREQGTNAVFLDEVRCIKELQGLYVRSFTISGDQILFPSGDTSYIIVADKDTLAVKMRFPVAPSIAGMVQIMPIGGYFYLTVSTDANYNQSMATIIRTNDLSSLADSVYEDVYYKFKSKGVPYYIESVDGSYCITCPSDSRSVWRFGIENDMIGNVRALY